MIAALDTDGQVWFSLSHSNTDSDVIAVFYLQMSKILEEDDVNWKDNTVFLLDNATYHWSSETQEIFHKLGLQIMYSGAYSFSASPVETLFS